MASTVSFSRREFTTLAAAGAGAALAGCVRGIFPADQELVLTLSGSGRLLGASGNVLATEPLAPATAAGLVGPPRVRAASVTSGIGTLRIPMPGFIGFEGSPAREPRVVTRVDRARDGSNVESRFETVGNGIPTRRTVRIPSHGVQLIDDLDYRPLGSLSVFQQRRIEVWQHGHLVADLTITATGQVRLASGPRFRPAAIARAFLPQELEAQSDCGVQLLVSFLSATLGVIAALGTCAGGPWCIIGLVGALIQWAQVIGEMEACRQT